MKKIRNILKITDYYINFLNYLVYLMFHGVEWITGILSPIFILYKVGEALHWNNLARKLGKNYCYIIESWDKHILHEGTDYNALGGAFIFINYFGVIIALLIADFFPIPEKFIIFWIIETLFFFIINRALWSNSKRKRYIRYFKRTRKKYIKFDMLILIICITSIIIVLFLGKFIPKTFLY